MVATLSETCARLSEKKEEGASTRKEVVKEAVFQLARKEEVAGESLADETSDEKSEPLPLTLQDSGRPEGKPLTTVRKSPCHKPQDVGKEEEEGKLEVKEEAWSQVVARHCPESRHTDRRLAAKPAKFSQRERANRPGSPQADRLRGAARSEINIQSRPRAGALSVIPDQVRMARGRFRPIAPRPRSGL